MFERAKFFLILSAIAVLLFSASANADVKFGARAGFYSDGNNAFIGGEILAPVFRDQWYFNPNLEYVFVNNGSLVTFNFDFHYDLNGDYPVYLWLGGGPAILHSHVDRPRGVSDTNVGVDLLFGVGFKIRHSDLVPYIQPKVILSNNSQFSLAFGLRF